MNIAQNIEETHDEIQQCPVDCAATIKLLNICEKLNITLGAISAEINRINQTISKPVGKGKR